MTSRVDFVPLIEIPTIKNPADLDAPQGTPAQYYSVWRDYMDRAHRRTYGKVFNPVSEQMFQYDMSGFDADDFAKILSFHLSGTTLAETCSLFGGYGLRVDGRMVLYPQCCALLEEIATLSTILRADFSPFYLAEGHPSPYFMRRGDELHIVCVGEYESFSPPTDPLIVVDYQSARQAVQRLLELLEHIGQVMDSVALQFDTSSISTYAIWGGARPGALPGVL